MSDPALVLELRIHGVNNTTPADMLELPADRVQQVDGDDLGSFWAPAANALDGVLRGEPAWVPPGVRREAYSWGGLARTSVAAGNGMIGTVTAALGRLGWAMLLPFGLANVAYWSRRLDVDPDPTRSTQGDPAGTGRGASLARLFGLLLTCLLVVTASEVALDLFAVQCFASDHTTRCTRLPSLVDALAGWSPAQRLALASLVPVLLLLGLRQLANLSASRYEAVSIVESPAEALATGTSGVLLSRGDFWAGRRGADAAASLHIAAGICLVVLGTAWPAVVGDGNDSGNECRRLVTVLTPACQRQIWSRAGASWPFGLMATVTFLLLCLVVAVHCVRSADAPDVAAGPTIARQRWLPRPGLLVAAATALLVVELLLLVGVKAPFPTYPPLSPSGAGGAAGGAAADAGAAGYPLAGLSFAPGVVIFLSLLVALSGLGWRGTTRTTDPLLAADDRRHTMWRGRAPGILMLLALSTATMLSAVVVLTVGNWLNGTRGAADLMAGNQGRVAAPPVPRPGCVDSCAIAPPDISIPSTYLWFGASTVLALLLLIVPAGVLLGLWWRQAPPRPAQAMADLLRRIGGTVDEALWRLPRRRSASRRALLLLEQSQAPIPPRPAGSPDPATDDDLPRDAAPLPSTPTPTRTSAPGSVAAGPMPGAALLAPSASARRFAAIAQHAEWLVLVVALVAGVALLLALVGSAADAAPSDAATGAGAVLRWFLNAGITGVASIGTLIVGGVVGGGVLRGQRPLGIVWDLMCFLPRAAHPLGPPCYAERAVPEITRRIRWWLDGEGIEPLDGPPPAAVIAAAAAVPADPAQPLPQGAGRHVVVSAHSLGCVLAAAAVCGLPDGGPHISLMTHGCQLRAYFSRLFPELLGPRILGTTPCPEPALANLDPWSGQDGVPAQPVLAAGSLRARLGGSDVQAPRWVNLWRRTDYLGFPVLGWRPPDLDPHNDVDRPAEEIDTSGYVAAVATHGNYARTLAYQVALEDLLARARTDGGPATGPQADLAT